MNYTAGIDIGSTYTKAVVANERGEMLGRALEQTGFRLAEAAATALERALAAAWLAHPQTALEHCARSAEKRGNAAGARLCLNQISKRSRDPLARAAAAARLKEFRKP